MVEQASQLPVFNIDWRRIAKPALDALLFIDSLAKTYTAALEFEKLVNHRRKVA